MRVSDFDFDLPPELIAQTPTDDRESARLLLVDRKGHGFGDRRVADLPDLLGPRDLLVINNTRVFPARLFGHRVPTGGAVECLLLTRLDGERWDALMHPGQKLRVGTRVRFEREGRQLHGEVLEHRVFGRRTIRLWVDGDSTVDELVDELGHIPLPPYIRRSDRPVDRDRYQTVYASVRGSVAAPTAGLHLTDAMLQRCAKRGIEVARLTLHVGYGTFKPVRVDRVEDHTVDAESYDVPPETADAVNRALDTGRRVVSVGTTTTRALETAARAGGGRLRAGRGVSDLYLYPGVPVQVVGALFTNFHLPRSSLLMLVSALGGRERVLDAYAAAVRRGYRFYSYGDGMLLL